MQIRVHYSNGAYIAVSATTRRDAARQTNRLARKLWALTPRVLYLEDIRTGDKIAWPITSQDSRK
jgi:hypothetical protein